MWLPLVTTSDPARKISSAVAGVRPFPPAAFSPLTTTRSGHSSPLRRGRTDFRIRRPGDPTTSPTNRIRMRASRSHRDPHGAGFPDHADLDLAGVGQLPLQGPGDLLGEGVGVFVLQDLRVHDDPKLLPRLDGVRSHDAGEPAGHRLEAAKPLVEDLQVVLARARARVRDSIRRGEE